MFPGTGLLEGRTTWSNCLRLSEFPKLRGLRVYLPCHQNISWGWTEKVLLKLSNLAGHVTILSSQFFVNKGL